jgi:hypothetical protein
MNFEQVFEKASVVRFNGGQRSEDHLIAFTEIITHSRRFAPRRENVGM